MTDESIIAAKQADNFTTESPIRAFTDFQVSGTIAIGKGFRPSLAHLARYLDAMEAKESWRFVQIVLPQDDKGDPTIIFHRERSIPAVIDMMAGAPSPEFAAKIREWLKGAAPNPVGSGRAQDEPDFGAEHNVTYLVGDDEGGQFVAYYSDGVWWEGHPGDGDSCPVQCQVTPTKLIRKSQDPDETTHWGETKWAESMEALVGRMRSAANRTEARSFMLDEKVQNIGHWQDTASIASRRRAEKRFPAPRKVGGGLVKQVGGDIERIENPTGYDVIFGNFSNPHEDMGAPHDTRLRVRVRSSVGNIHEFPAIFKDQGGWHLITGMKGDDILGLTALRGRPVAWRLGDDQPWTPDWTAAGSTDPIPDEHYVEAAEFVIRRAMAECDALYQDRAIADFKKRFRPRKDTKQVTHTNLLDQLVFILGSHSSRPQIQEFIDVFRRNKRANPDLGRGVEP